MFATAARLGVIPSLRVCLQELVDGSGEHEHAGEHLDGVVGSAVDVLQVLVVCGVSMEIVVFALFAEETLVVLTLLLSEDVEVVGVEYLVTDVRNGGQSLERRRGVSVGEGLEERRLGPVPIDLLLILLIVLPILALPTLLPLLR
jgi:hypothetical protein